MNIKTFKKKGEHEIQRFSLAVQIPQLFIFICWVQIEEVDYSANSINNFIFANSFFFLTTGFRKVFQEEDVWTFYFVLPVVNTIYYFAEWHTYRAASYWQVNCRVHQQSCLFLCFWSTHLLELSEALCITQLLWSATSSNMFELAPRRPFWVGVYFRGEWQVLTKLKEFLFSHIARRAPCR